MPKSLLDVVDDTNCLRPVIHLGVSCQRSNAGSDLSSVDEPPVTFSYGANFLESVIVNPLKKRRLYRSSPQIGMPHRQLRCSRTDEVDPVLDRIEQHRVAQKSIPSLESVVYPRSVLRCPGNTLHEIRNERAYT